jgi:dephospho-CoA kinase
MKHIEKIVSEFDQKFVNYFGSLDRQTIRPKYQENPQEIKSFLRQSHTTFIQNLIQRVEGERGKTKTLCCYETLDTIIKMLKEEI